MRAGSLWSGLCSTAAASERPDARPADTVRARVKLCIEVLVEIRQSRNSCLTVVVDKATLLCVLK